MQTYTYNPEDPGPNDYVRFLIPDTEFIPDVAPPRMIFSDQEIDMMFQIQQSSAFQSAQFFSGAQGRTLPSLPVSYYRVAAIGLDTLANNKAKLAGVLQLLDVKLQDSKSLSQALRDGAQAYRDLDDNSGSFVIIEQVQTDWAWRDRWIKQWMRQANGAVA